MKIREFSESISFERLAMAQAGGEVALPLQHWGRFLPAEFAHFWDLSIFSTFLELGRLTGFNELLLEFGSLAALRLSYFVDPILLWMNGKKTIKTRNFTIKNRATSWKTWRFCRSHFGRKPPFCRGQSPSAPLGLPDLRHGFQPAAVVPGATGEPRAGWGVLFDPGGESSTSVGSIWEPRRPWGAQIPLGESGCKSTTSQFGLIFSMAFPWWFPYVCIVPGLVNIQKTIWKITILKGKNHYFYDHFQYNVRRPRYLSWWT